MSIFDKVKKGMLDSTKTLKEISSEMTEMTRLKVSLAKDKAQLDELYYNLGKILYASYEQNEDTYDLPKVVVSAFTELKQTHVRIYEVEHRIEFLKGILKCNQCGCEVEDEAKFCSNCGNQLFVTLHTPNEDEFVDVPYESVESVDAVEEFEETKPE